MDSLFDTLCRSAGVGNVSAAAMGYGRNQGTLHSSWGRMEKKTGKGGKEQRSIKVAGKHLVKQGFRQGQVNALFASA